MSPNGDKGKRPATAFNDKLDPRGKTEKRPATAFNAELELHGKTGKRRTILSIDGGGVRGIIPARILQKLEKYLASEVNKFGAHPAQKCRFFTHPTHPKNWQFQYVASALTSGFSSL